MIVSRQKPFTEILTAIGDSRTVFLVGCAKCATVCKAGGEEEVWQMQEALTAEGKEVTGSLVIDEACHMLRASRDLRGRKEMVEEAEAVLVLACGAGVQSISSALPQKVIAGLDTLFLGNIRRFGQFEQKCSLCGECILTGTGGICPVTVCAKGLLNGPCGGMDNGRCETDAELECAWYQIYTRLQNRGEEDSLRRIILRKDFSKMLKPGKLKNER
ncbi:methylenetetrahydrofolate reductase C-terminal domain-containing protein [Geobacter sp. DSM 9736]|uniref:methylenetetrahydrofolate reductase C-terminal domain-containing protein n=1 Tax=Geobacter sp. DSM 9736 TaxID=1277350 RepID=UPI000B50F3C4|nr:methylenetetrahydrofolate reductase C-terminal domain-containing protein [Geobacter sp. DSM 9736]SNB45921.1 Methylene-tetrahydrofolate reductase C terminal [Geobacter sp. DSM 9736]